MNRGTLATLAASAGLILGLVSPTAAAQESAPKPVRNDVAKPGEELFVLRNHRLRKGGHEPFYESSRDGVWPYFERTGPRIVGQWQVIPAQAAAPADVEDVYRLVRYASFEHWQATRTLGGIGGNGPASDKDQKGRRERGALEVGSKGAYFLQGQLAPGGPYFMPALLEKYELVQPGQRPDAGESAIPVRMDIAQAGKEIVVVRYQRIEKGAFARFIDLTRASIWPWEEKLGARPIGQWRVIFPEAPDVTERSRGTSFMTAQSPAYDEVITLTRYASTAHRDAMAPDVAVYMGGNGPDWQAWRGALEAQRKLTLLTSDETAQGFLYQSPPIYLPGVAERYRRLE